MTYIGEECFKCGNKFENGDDVVVCPECGTPYHRECYKEAGECINHQLHESGGIWKRTVNAQENAPSVSAVICPKCRNSNEPSAKFCQKCGFQLNDTEINSETAPLGAGMPFIRINMDSDSMGFNSNEELSEGVTIREAADFVDSNRLYYIPLFKRMKALKSKISFNFVCLFFPYFYFANRKMWLPAIVTALISALLSIPDLLTIIGSQSELIPFMGNINDFIYTHSDKIQNFSDIFALGSWILRISCCLFANWIYFRHTVKSISKVKAYYGGPVSPKKLKSIGGVKPINIIFMGLILMGISLAVEFGVMAVLTFTQM